VDVYRVPSESLSEGAGRGVDVRPMSAQRVSGGEGRGSPLSAQRVDVHDVHSLHGYSMDAVRSTGRPLTL
jgi:hypothetical protein